MRRRLAVAAARAVRAVRGLWPDRNPLRRSLDRVEAAIVGGLVVAFLAGAPLMAHAAGSLAYSASSRAAHAQQLDWHQVPAMLLAAPTSGAYGSTAPARWAAPDGTPRTGTVAAAPSAKAGNTVMVWEDVAGQLSGAPLRLYEVEARAVMASWLAVVGLGLTLLAIGGLAHGRLTRRRLAAWDADWQATEPRWTKRR
jgi:hypothetical protein